MQGLPPVFPRPSSKELRMRQIVGKSLTWRFGIAVKSVGVTVSPGSGPCEVPFYPQALRNTGVTRISSKTCGLRLSASPEEASEGLLFNGNGKGGPRAVRAAHTGVQFAARTFPEAKAEMAKGLSFIHDREKILC